MASSKKTIKIILIILAFLTLILISEVIYGLNNNSLKDYKLAQASYTLGLLAYKYNQPEVVIPLFRTAIYIDPELSHFHVELANFYFKKGDEEQTKKALDYCQKFSFPRIHCQQYIDNNLRHKVPENVGFLEEAVERHYQ